ncbi:PD-(D/E)XK nuclease family protein [Gemella cuniculi]|uniref:PD-(D/E)XK nuclease family protein n=1 Tax=Gemella cuniculi TaxID=150240 RepID=UPI00040A69E6|nr:PD-(D/E)XK nuclease family protein [Gemella cuniculi]
MELELVVSPSGFGKTHFILDDIEKTRNNNKIIILTPEQNSFNFEKILCERFGGTFNIDVMNFSSLTKKFGKMLGLENLKNLSDDVKPFYFYKAAINLANTQNFLVARILQDSNFIEVVNKIIKELKEYKVTVGTLEEYLEKNPNLEIARKNKLEAILEIYLEYTRLIKIDNVFDKEDYVNELLFYMKYLDLSDYIFYIDAYYNFTAQEYSYIEKLILNSKKVVLSVIADANRYFNFDLGQITAGFDLSNLEYNQFYLSDLHKNDKYKLDIFRKSHEVVASINEIIYRNIDIRYRVVALVSKNEIYTLAFEICKNKVTNFKVLNSHESRFKGSANFCLASEYYKAFKSSRKNDNSIALICAKNKELEIRQVAREILKLKIKENISNSDVAILYRDKVYENYQYIFKDYGLDIHIDKDIDVSNHRLIKFLTQVLNIDKLTFKNGILNILKTKLSNFENIYKRKVISSILFDKTDLNEKSFLKNFSELSKEEIQDRITKEENDLVINEFFEYSLEEISSNVKYISIFDLENIFNEKLITSASDLDTKFFVESTYKYNKKQLELCRETIIELYNEILNISKKDNIPIKRYVKKIENLFNYCNIRMYLDKEDGEYDDIEELKIDSIDRQVYKKTLQLLNNIIETFGEEKISYKKFVDLLTMGFKTIKYRSIPEINNSIVMSTMDLAKVENKKIVFVIGFNKDVLPMSKKADLLDDEDKENFSDENIFLSPTVKSSLIDEEFVAYIALTRAIRKTYITYSTLDKSFKENFSSPYLAVVKALLSDLEEKTTDKILEFNTTYYDYYVDNMNEILNSKEFNYLFSKLYRRFLEVQTSNQEEAEKLSILLTKFLENYIVPSIENEVDSYKVYEQLHDRIYFDRDSVVKNYLGKIIRNYKFELSFNNIENFLNKKSKQFSKFSISKISDYEKNPYLFFVKRILGIQEEREVDIDNLVVGRFFHAVMADKRIIDFIGDCANQIDIEVISDEDIIKNFAIRKIVEDVIFEKTNKDIVEVLNLIKVLKTRSYILKNMINRLILAIGVEIKYKAITKYGPEFLEKEFSLTITNSKITCKDLETEEIIVKDLDREYNIPNINFVGFIDRVDGFGKNITIIDYKSSKTDFELEKIELGFVSQILTYALACELLFNKKSEDILGIFYREIAKIGKDINTYRLRGLANSDLILQSDFKDETKNIAYVRTTKKGIHASDSHKVYNSDELEFLINKNLHNMMKLLEEIYKFDYSLRKYDIEDEYLTEKWTLFNYAANLDTRLELLERVELSKKDLRKKILESKN